MKMLTQPLVGLGIGAWISIPLLYWFDVEPNWVTWVWVSFCSVLALIGVLVSALREDRDPS